jgi:protein O-GlcNAc transferase
MTQAALSLAAELHRAGRLDEAEVAYREVIAADASNAEAWHLLGTLLVSMGKVSEGATAIRRAIELNGQRADFHVNLAVALLKLGQPVEAANACQMAISLRPDWAEAWYNLGCATGATGRWDIAIDSYRRAISLNPDHAQAHFNLGDALRHADRGDEALESFRKAAQLRPTAEAFNNLGNSLQMQDRFAEAIQAFESALALQPDSINARSNLGLTQFISGRADEAVRTLRMVQHVPFAADNLLFASHSVANPDPATIFQEHRNWARRFADPLAREIQPLFNSCDPNRRLRVGYISSDFHLHSVTFFLENLLGHHDPDHVEIFAYADVTKSDAVTRRLQQSIHHWRPIAGRTDAEVAGMIRQDQIDILVDLAGHTSGNRLLVLARKPAPVQITYLGYPDTTGLSAIDFRMTDSFADPPGATEQFHSEKLLRLPRTFACYRPPEDAPDVSPSPAGACGRVTFAGFTALAKISQKLLDFWAEILLQIPNSRLLIAAGGLHSPDIQREIRAPFDKKRIDPARLELMGKLPLKDYLALHNQADIYLDTFPVNGHTVTCHALWMGLPVITLAGQVHCQRLGASVLGNLGMPDQVAKTPDEYVQIAGRLVSDIPKLEETRSGLRDRMKSSPIMDSAEFARDVESAYRSVWKNWCASSRPL